MNNLPDLPNKLSKNGDKSLDDNATDTNKYDAFVERQSSHNKFSVPDNIQQFSPEMFKYPIAQAYVPRSRLRRLLPPIIVIGFTLIEFIFCYNIAANKSGLLGIQFLIGVPLFIGATAVYLASYYRPITNSQVFLLTFWLVLGILIISVPVLREGMICIVIASPIIYIAMLLGGLGMRLLCLKVWQTKSLFSVALLPFLVLFVPLEQTPETYQVTDSIVINASAEQVWQSINHIKDIEPKEFYQESRLLPFMQVPTPKSAITVWENDHWVRKCEWHGGITFDEPLISQIPNRQLRWQFVFYPDSVPPNTLDDHVTINGEHFKLLLGQYDLEPINEQSTKLTFNVTYRISTNINFYAGFWGKWVMSEFVEDTLGLYKHRLEGV